MHALNVELWGIIMHKTYTDVELILYMFYSL